MVGGAIKHFLVDIGDFPCPTDFGRCRQPSVSDGSGSRPSISEVVLVSTFTTSLSPLGGSSASSGQLLE